MEPDAFFAAVTEGRIDDVRSALAAEPALAQATGPKKVSPLRMALYHRKNDVAALLAEQGGILDLYDAAAIGDEAVVWRFLDETPNLVSRTSLDGFTPLHLAAFFGRFEAAALLMGRGAPPNVIATDGSRLTPLHSAAATGQNAIIGLLLAAGADVDADQRGGFTALHAAAKRGDVGLVRLLLAWGATVGKKADDGKIAAEMTESEAVRGLLAEVVAEEG